MKVFALGSGVQHLAAYARELESQRDDLLAACKKAIAAYDKAHAYPYTATWSGSDVDEMRAAIAKAEGKP